MMSFENPDINSNLNGEQLIPENPELEPEKVEGPASFIPDGWAPEAKFETRWGLAGAQTLDQKKRQFDELLRITKTLDGMTSDEINTGPLTDTEVATGRRISELNAERGRVMGLPEGETGAMLAARYFNLLKDEIAEAEAGE